MAIFFLIVENDQKGKGAHWEKGFYKSTILLFNNQEEIRIETIAYLRSSSFPFFLNIFDN